jgi:hypothetical protein
MSRTTQRIDRKIARQLAEREWENTARAETLSEVEEILYRVAKAFFPEDEAKSEAGHAYLDAYARYDPSRMSKKGKNRSFEEFVGEVTYYHCVKESGRRKKFRYRWRQFTVTETENGAVEASASIPDHRTPISIDDHPVWTIASKLSEEAQYVISYVMNPPKKVDKQIRESVYTTVDLRRVWRKHLTSHLMTTKNWPLSKIERVFRSIGLAVAAYSPTRIASVGV